MTEVSAQNLASRNWAKFFKSQWNSKNLHYLQPSYAPNKTVGVNGGFPQRNFQFLLVFTKFIDDNEWWYFISNIEMYIRS